MSRRARIFFTAMLFVAGGASPAAATPPEGGDRRFQDWFEKLRQPSTGAPCCSIADCRRTEARHNGTGWEALIDERFGEAGARWTPVPPQHVLDQANPTGEAVVCFLPSQGIMCFVPPPET